MSPDLADTLTVGCKNALYPGDSAKYIQQNRNRHSKRVTGWREGSGINFHGKNNILSGTALFHRNQSGYETISNLYVIPKDLE